jgi:hypothetical protein
MSIAPAGTGLGEGDGDDGVGAGDGDDVGAGDGVGAGVGLDGGVATGGGVAADASFDAAFVDVPAAASPPPPQADRLMAMPSAVRHQAARTRAATGRMPVCFISIPQRMFSAGAVSASGPRHRRDCGSAPPDPAQ